MITPNNTRATASVNSPVVRENADKVDASVTEKATYHTVVSGDTYFGIASKYNLSLRELLELNNRSSQARLISGQKLLVNKDAARPEKVETEAAPVKTAPERVTVTRPALPAETFKTPEEVRHETRATATPGSEYHVVQGGQTFYSISKAYGLSMKELYDLNDLTSSDRLRTGQKLRVRKADGGESTETASPASTSGGAQTHTVAPGETLFRIAQTYRTNVEDLKRLNNMSGNSVMVGQKLKIPQQ